MRRLTGLPGGRERFRLLDKKCRRSFLHRNLVFSVLSPAGGWSRCFGARLGGQDQALTEAELARALGWLGPAWIGLVPGSRPADVLALVGYGGTVNRYGTSELLSVALRS